FSLQAAFKRRDRALEYFSLFKAGAIALNNSFLVAEDLPSEKKTEARNILMTMVDKLIYQLENRVVNYASMQIAVDKVLEFIKNNREGLSNRNVLRMIRYLRDVTEGSTYLISLVRHRTMLGLQFYAVVFILIFPIVQAPIIYNRLGDLVDSWVIYLLLAIGSLILVTLSTFQRMIEYPFDPKGMDNIQLRDFALDI
ncbi:MAG TPA: hypothetical protein VGQ59_13455, partial [Cyclobacteriaceae bacterium]|nr:hypothetical protein [Cyclobacteriaceae bacterium]